MKVLLGIMIAAVLAIVGAAFGAFVSFWALFGVSRAISWLLHDDEYMNLMWAGILLIPLGAAFGVGASQAILILGAEHRQNRSQRRGFEVMSKDSDGSK
jgi:hypothetical protein